jgi:16S rRNA (uracil1498-N3)-methyltransferase
MRRLLQAWTAAAAAAHTLDQLAAASLMPQLATCCEATAAAAAAAPAAHRHQWPGQLGKLRSSHIVMLNRVLVEPDECTVEGDGTLVARLPPKDPRTAHLHTHLKAASGKLVRAGVLDAGATDAARVEWEREPGAPSAADEPAERTPPATMRLELGDATELLRAVPESERPRLDLLLAMPRPTALSRMLPMISSMGVANLWITGARRVEKAYWSSHLLKAGNEGKLRELLVEGLVQSGDTAVPRVVTTRNLARLLREEPSFLDGGNSEAPLVKLACHPERPASADGQEAADPRLRVRRLGEVELPPNARLVLAIGPERGWDEPEELELLVSHGFQLVTLGPRTLRSDVACISMLAVAHEALEAASRRAAARDA